MATASIASYMPEFMARSAGSNEEPRFERLIEPHLGEAFALAQALSTDRGSAQDAVQNAAFKAWRRMPQLRDEGSARSWFLAIVVNECRTSWRKRKAMPADIDAGSGPINWPLGVDQRLDVRSAMQRLKRDDRVVLSLRFLMDMSVEETAAVLGISVSAVKARTARAATRFRALMAQPGEAE
jgi:RNA polymerase sigma-70 factor, ECF subfamily